MKSAELELTVQQDTVKDRPVRPGLGALHTRAPETSSYRFIIETIVFLTYVAFGVSWAATGTFLKDIMDELSIGLSRASFINTSISIAKIFGPVLAGIISAKIGLKRAFLLASFFISLGIFAPIAPGYPLLLLARFAMGLGSALVMVYFTPITMQWFPENERVAVNGLNFVSVSAGMTVGLWATPFFMSVTGATWKTTLIIYSLFSILLTAFWALFGKEKDSAAKGGDEENLEKRSRTGYRSIMKDSNTWKLIFCYFGILSFYLSVFTYFPTFYRTVRQFPPDSWGAQAPALVMFASIPSALLGIWLSNKISSRTALMKVSGILLIPAGLGMFLTSSHAVTAVSALVAGFCLFIWRPSFFTIPQELPGSCEKKAGAMMSIFWAVSYLAATFNVWLAGVLTEITGSFVPGFVFLVALTGTLLVGSFMIPEKTALHVTV